MKYELVLEGGGAKGAYQVGVYKALIEAGYEFDVVVGTSIGAINAAFLVQGEFDKLYNFWSTLSFADIFDVDEKDTENMDEKFLTKYLSKKLGQTLKEKGIDTKKIRAILENNLDEEKIRKSKIRFGLVTMCISDMKPEELFIEDIPEGKLIDYIMASSNLPVFQRSKIDEKSYIDGGAWDACPAHMLEVAGYKNAIIIRVFKKTSRIRGYKGIVSRGKLNMYMIEPNEMLPSIFNFSSKNLNELLSRGYYDGLRFTKEYAGFNYYFKSIPEKIVIALKKIDISTKFDIVKEAKITYSVGENIDDVFSRAVESISKKTKVKNIDDIEDMIVAIFEYVADIENIEKYKVYDFSKFVKIVKEKLEQKQESLGDDKALYDFVKAYKL